VREGAGWGGPIHGRFRPGVVNRIDLRSQPVVVLNATEHRQCDQPAGLRLWMLELGIRIGYPMDRLWRAGRGARYPRKNRESFEKCLTRGARRPSHEPNVVRVVDGTLAAASCWGSSLRAESQRVAKVNSRQEFSVRKAPHPDPESDRLEPPFWSPNSLIHSPNRESG